MQEIQVQTLSWEDPLEEEMATSSSILAWKIPWTEEPGGFTVHGVPKSCTLLSDLAGARAHTHTHTHTHTHMKSLYKSIKSKRILFEQAPGVSDGQGSLVCCNP